MLELRGLANLARDCGELMETLLIIGLVVVVALLLSGTRPVEPRIIQIAIDPEPPAPSSASAILFLLIALGVLALLGLL